jgi:hypothetical protein
LSVPATTVGRERPDETVASLANAPTHDSGARIRGIFERNAKKIFLHDGERLAARKMTGFWIGAFKILKNSGILIVDEWRENHRGPGDGVGLLTRKPRKAPATSGTRGRPGRVATVSTRSREWGIREDPRFTVPREMDREVNGHASE